MVALVALSPRALADQIEFLTGARAEGTVKKIDKEGKKIDFELQIAGRTLTRTYTYSQIHAVTLGEKRYVLNPMPSDSTQPPGTGGGAADGADPAARGSSTPEGPASTRLSKAQVQRLIDEAGKRPPDWYESTPLNYPQTLDLSFPEPAPGGWNNQKNVGQYVWDIINPNANRWREGTRFMHHLLSVNKDNAVVRKRVMMALGDMYFRFFQDYARAAFWWQQAGVGAGDPQSVYLAECYWRLGSKPMAEELLNQRTVYLAAVKLWGDMGETRKAVELAEKYVSLGGPAHEAYLLAGDACRTAGQLEQALRYYERVTKLPAPAARKEHFDRAQKRAQASAEAIRLFELSDPRKVADGAYRAQSLGYEGPVEVEVQVRSGRIESVEVTQHKEKQYYSALSDVPRQILEKQGVKGVDATSKATITAEAVLNAAAKALAEGAR